MWRQDVPAPSTAAVLLIDYALLLGLFAATFALVLLVLGRPATAAYASLFVSAVGIALSLTVLLVQTFQPWRDRPITVLALVALVTSGLNAWLRGARPKLTIGISRKVGAGILAVGLLPALQFWQSTSFLPSRTQVSLSQVLDVEVTDRAATGYHAVVAVTVENTSDTRALVIISDLKICDWTRTSEVVSEIDTLRSRPNCVSKRPIAERAWIDGKSTLRYSVAVETPSGRPLLQLISRIAYARGDRLREVPRTERELNPAELGGCASGRQRRPGRLLRRD